MSTIKCNKGTLEDCVLCFPFWLRMFIKMHIVIDKVNIEDINLEIYILDTFTKAEEYIKVCFH